MKTENSERGRQFATADEAITWLAGEPAKRMQGEIDRLKYEVAWRTKNRKNEKNAARRARNEYRENIKAVIEQRDEARKLLARLFMRSAPFVTGYLGFWDGMGDVGLDTAWDKAKEWLDAHPEESVVLATPQTDGSDG